MHMESKKSRLKEKLPELNTRLHTWKQDRVSFRDLLIEGNYQVWAHGNYIVSLVTRKLLDLDTWTQAWKPVSLVTGNK
jgi:hypothetical protein